MNRYIYPNYKRAKTYIEFSIRDRVIYTDKYNKSIYGVVTRLVNNSIFVHFDDYDDEREHQMFAHELIHEQI